jgi:hypothetical protein
LTPVRALSTVLILALVAAAVLRLPSAVMVVLGAAAIAAIWFRAPLRSRPSTSLSADIRDLTPDLHRILAGIVADEGGRISSSNGSMLADFPDAAAAVHAAQRMLSNVDAVQRRLEREVRFTIGVGSTSEAAAELERAARDRRIAVLIGAGIVTKLGSTPVTVAAIDEHDRLFSFVPVQQRLPGF